MLAALGRFDEAAVAIERSISLEPGYAPSHWRLGTYRLELGDLDAAQRSFARARELDPTFPGGSLGVARVHLQREEGERAREILEQLRVREPENTQVLQLLACARRQVGLPLETGGPGPSGNAEPPVWNDPWELEARAYREGPLALQAGQLIQRGDADEALSLLEEARASGADQGDLALRFARAYLKLGRTQEAERELATLLAREPENTRAHMLSARMHEQRGDLTASLAELETVLRIEPDHGPALAAQGLALYRLGQRKADFERAARSLSRAIELGSEEPEVHFTLGQALIALRRWDEAQQRFLVLLGHVPGHGDAWSGLARARLELGDLEGCAEASARAEAAGVEQRAFLDDVQSRLEKASARRGSEEDSR
jgi:tetratricopeptide (TPR) repeat protein